MHARSLLQQSPVSASATSVIASPLQALKTTSPAATPAYAPIKPSAAAPLKPHLSTESNLGTSLGTSWCGCKCIEAFSHAHSDDLKCPFTC